VRLLDLVDELGIPRPHGIVNVTARQRPGHMKQSWPDAGMTPFRNEKNSTGKGPTGYPRWCAGRGTSSPAACSPASFQPSRLVATRCWPPPGTGLKQKVPGGSHGGQQGLQVISMAYNMLDLLDPARPTPAPGGLLLLSLMMAISPPCVYTTGSFGFIEQAPCTGTLQIWAEPFTVLRIPQESLTLLTDPYERATIFTSTPTGIGCWTHVFLF